VDVWQLAVAAEWLVKNGHYTDSNNDDEDTFTGIDIKIS